MLDYETLYSMLHNPPHTPTTPQPHNSTTLCIMYEHIAGLELLATSCIAWLNDIVFVIDFTWH